MRQRRAAIGRCGTRLVLATSALLPLGACAGSPEPAPAWIGAYPVEASQERTLDIQVFRDERIMRLTNTTPHDLPPGRIWINQWFSYPLASGLPAGESLELDLGVFRDEFGERYRAGGFWATEEPDELALVQYEVQRDEAEPVLLGMVIIKGGER